MKKILCLLLSVLMAAGALSLSAFAADDAVAYISFAGADTNDGKTADTPKKTLGKLSGNGAVSLLKHGGTLVASQKLYFGADYIWDVPGAVTITANYGGKDYKNPEPEKNPASGMMKFKSGATLTIKSDVTIDDIILFQEGAQNTIVVKPSTTLIITDKVVLMSKPGVEHHFRIVIESGATAILSEEAQSTMTIENSGELLTYQSAEPVTPTEPESKFTASRTYADAFTDVPANAWFYAYVKTAYEYALANGTGKTSFSPDTTFTVAQALTAAANIHKAYTGKTIDTAGAANWYDPYVSYCVANGIITADQFAADKMNRPISRGDMAIVFANILPESEYTVVREKALTDVEDGAAYAAAVRKLANAGIVGGDAGTGKFRPADDIKRSEACVIFTRIAVASMRDTKKD